MLRASQSRPVLLSILLFGIGAGRACADRPVVSGAAAPDTNIDKLCDTNFAVDNQSSLTIVSRSCATMMGLLDSSGNPVGSSGSSTANNGALSFWCFSDISVVAIGTNGVVCGTIPAMVYVSKTNDYPGMHSTLGTNWMQGVGGTHITVDASGAQTATWMQPKSHAGSYIDSDPTIDHKSGIIQQVYAATLTSAQTTIVASMVVSMGAAYSVIPQHLATSLGLSVIGSVDLSVADPDFLESMQLASMDLTGQTIFNVVQVPSVYLGIGQPGTMVDFLVSNDDNSDFGILGANALQAAIAGDNLFDLGINQDGTSTLTYAVPEPGTFILLSLGLGGLAVFRRLRRGEGTGNDEPGGRQPL